MPCNDTLLLSCLAVFLHNHNVYLRNGVILPHPVIPKYEEYSWSTTVECCVITCNTGIGMEKIALKTNYTKMYFHQIRQSMYMDKAD